MRRRHDDLDFILAHRARRKKRSGRLRRRQRVGVLAAAVAVIAVGVVVSAGAGIAFSAGCDLSALKPVEIGQNSFVYADDGSLLGTIPAERNREPVTSAAMSPWLSKATVAIEDRRFYEHGGIDYLGIARAAWTDVTAGKVVEGGSTITQQLVRNLYTGQERTFNRKVKEACLAIKLAHRWSKAKILNDYLNTVYYGNHAYGVEAAAQTYFSEHAKDLTLLQSALLAGLPQAPSIYDPLHDPQAALQRRDEVLQAMLRDNAITPAAYHQAIQSRSLDLKPGNVYTHISQPYFFSYVIDQLEQHYGANTVREGGLQVYTTIDPKLQFLAKRAINDVLPLKTDPAAAIVSVEPGTGAIRAMTAVVRTKGNQFNLVAQSLRQAGLDVQDVRARGRDREGHRPRHGLHHVGAVHLHGRPVVLDQGSVAGAHVRQHVPRHGVGDPRDAVVRQHRVRAAHARRRPAERVGDGEPARRADVPEPPVRVDRARLAGRRSARHGCGLRDVPGDGRLRQAHRDREGRSAGRQGRLELGQAHDEARALAGRRLEGDRRAGAERSVRHGRRLG